MGPRYLDLRCAVPRVVVRQIASGHAIPGRRSSIDGPEIPAAALCAISRCGPASRSIRQGSLRQARHSLGCALAPRSGRDDGIVGRASPRSIAADRRGLQGVARHCCEGGDRSHLARVDPPSRRPRVHCPPCTTQRRRLACAAVKPPLSPPPPPLPPPPP